MGLSIRLGPRSALTPGEYRRSVKALPTCVSSETPKNWGQSGFPYATARLPRAAQAKIHSDPVSTVEIVDDGPGFPLHLLPRLGQPYLSGRSGGTEHMGLGIFIAQTLLERTGAHLDFANLADGGGHVSIRWERAVLEAREDRHSKKEVPA
jgi:two-component system sensor histidine kinase RegB